MSAPSSSMDLAAAGARALLASESVGVLSTLSVRHAGTPYGSITPYALSADGAPLLLLSGLAAHTHNLKADPRAGLFVGDRSAAADPQAGARISLLGQVRPLPADAEPDARARYLARWPQAAQYLALSDFTFWRFQIDEARLVAGFGEIRWLPASALLTTP
ncbi:MAG TPA: pyridoxamine 5'-phosphate oxidase family protein [Polyangia bacterium]|nr:pyridoxamine 5'-phosphate oxidase family protein [Polyangia bacterium]